MLDIMRTVHGAYAPASEPFGARLETFFIGLCVAIGDMDGKPFSVAKIASYMRVPRTTVIRRLAQLQSWGLIDRRGRHYHLHEKTLNSHDKALSRSEAGWSLGGLYVLAGCALVVRFQGRGGARSRTGSMTP
jgi:hypothetical protein